LISKARNLSKEAWSVQKPRGSQHTVVPPRGVAPISFSKAFKAVLRLLLEEEGAKAEAEATRAVKTAAVFMVKDVVVVVYFS